MINDKLRSSLFGYSKESVYEYIAELNKEFSERILKNDSEHNARIKELEDTINQLKLDNMALRQKESEITVALLEAQQYTKFLKAEALSVHNENLKKTEEKHQEARARIESVMDDITQFEKEIAQTLENIRADLQNFEKKSEELTEKLDGAGVVIGDFGQESEEEPVKKAEKTKSGSKVKLSVLA